MRPYGAWVVIAPFNFPFALAGGPVAAALVTGNTVVVQVRNRYAVVGPPACRNAARRRIPGGHVQLSVGHRAASAGEALVRDPLTAGITFTGSVPVGRSIMQQMAGGAYPRPCIAEMGGKNPCIVTEQRRSRARRRRHRALGVRHGRAEVLGAVAPLRARARRRCS